MQIEDEATQLKVNLDLCVKKKDCFRNMGEPFRRHSVVHIVYNGGKA